MKHLAVLAAVVVTLFVAGSPAVADPGWQRIPCFSGAIERAEVTDGNYLTLTGYLDCGVPKDSPGPLWGYTVFVAGLPYGTLNNTDLHPYSFEDRTAFSDRMRVEGLPKLGICVVTDFEVRVACVSVTLKFGTSPSLAAPIPVDDELVNKPFLRRSEGEPSPVCGHC